MFPTLRRQPPRKEYRCGWEGPHLGQAAVGVEIGWPCQHMRGYTTPTCPAHLDRLLLQGGKASEPARCPECGVVAYARVVGTHDLDQAC